MWTLDEMKAVCDTAHALGVPVTAHCRNASSTRDAARAGVDLILHASFIDDEGARGGHRVRRRDLPDVHVPRQPRRLRRPGRRGRRDERHLPRRDQGDCAAMMRTAYDAGVRLLCGSESGFALTPYGHWHARETGGVRQRTRPDSARGDHRARPGTTPSPCGWTANSASSRQATAPTCSWSTATLTVDVTVLQDRRPRAGRRQPRADRSIWTCRGRHANGSPARRSATGRPRCSPSSAPSTPGRVRSPASWGFVNDGINHGHARRAEGRPEPAHR